MCETFKLPIKLPIIFVVDFPQATLRSILYHAYIGQGQQLVVIFDFENLRLSFITARYEFL
jgi:hypothetical protein